MDTKVGGLRFVAISWRILSAFFLKNILYFYDYLTFYALL